jgi:putative membrane protein
MSGTLILATSCTESNTNDSEKVADQGNNTNLDVDDETILVIENEDNDDAKFLIAAAELQMEEISLGKLAQQMGSSDHVKELGKMMETDHTKTLAELKALAQSKSVSIPGSLTEDSRDAYDNLQDESGNDFGKAYSKLMVEHHEDAIKLFEKAANDADDSEIRSWASSKLAGLRTHLEQAEACKEKCEKMQS